MPALELELTEKEADVVRSALARYLNFLMQAGSMNPKLDYFAKERISFAVLEKLEKAEGRE